MPSPSRSSLLRRALLLDALASGALGALSLVLAAPLSELLALPAALLVGAGLVLLPFAAAVYLIARWPAPRQAAWAVVSVNALWVAGSLLILAAGLVSPSPLGAAFVLAQAAAVALFASLQAVGLRREHGAPLPT